MINEHFNKEEKRQYVDMSYPTAEARQNSVLEKYKSLSLEGIVDEKKGPEEGTKNQAIFVENLRHRIDARIVKNLKDNKKMAMREMLDKVMIDLGLHMTMPTAQEQVEELRQTIEKRAKDLHERQHIKIVQPGADTGETEPILHYCSA